ncbi:MAG: gamma-glutamyl-gamma-aminobutyrate hydrolase family protein [Dethiobacteria bacterium]|nr:gamma-glutamyl-gamma-aminobutyrate hydrolase family protein [Bacillota bacterium]NMD33985.1 gamma-glutamyl-gamma-aminobutyrate hydrolase family protein [Bacillota bacterium]HOB28719.1 gamma-glutamyl-gamma-aminobutyrate hydrolase family protein [Bacillota bacterium]HPZ41407.1 gamma-glutamyl-gamma-aminobutyrate hydrolase family protein [Bacillota bacterium]HQD51674.1 gamma-glutamyl-gamma-aminobutyrate hydrolase family protein [Bacillota bacterium]
MATRRLWLKIGRRRYRLLFTGAVFDILGKEHPAMPEALRQRPLVGITVNRNYHRRELWLPPAYSCRIEEAGALPLLLPPLQPAAAGALLGSLNGLLLSGGGDVAPLYYGKEPRPGLDEVDLQRDAWELALVRAALARGLPVLGICRGIQLLNIALGGTLIQDLNGPGYLQHCQKAPRHHPSHTVEIFPRTRLASLLGEGHLAVNSFHHQAPAAVAPGLKKAAVSPDGVIEALEDPKHGFLIAVQWHPETLLHPASCLLFQEFVHAASKFC